MDPNQQSPSPHPAPTPQPDLTYIRNLDTQIQTLRLHADTLQTSLFELVDSANNLHFTSLDAETTSLPPHITHQRQLHLAAQIRALEAQEDLTNASLSKCKKELDDYWEAYAISACRALCDAVVAKLPRELRIMVCEMVWGPVTEHVLTPWVMNRAGPAISDAAMEIEGWGERGMAHCLDARFVGGQLQGELREAWWAASVLRFTAPEVVEWFFEGEFERLGVRGLVRRVRVELWYREYVARGRGMRLKGEVMGSKKGGCLEEDLRVLEALGRHTEVGLVIKKKDGDYRRDSVEVRRGEFLKSVSRMFPAVGRLQREGYRVSVEIGRGIEVRVGSEVNEEEWRRQIDAAVEALGNTHPYDTDCWPRMPIPGREQSVNDHPAGLYPAPMRYSERCFGPYAR